jgi:hypothetical protein
LYSENCVSLQRILALDLTPVWGYAEFLEVIRNPKHPEHEEMLEWVGGDFDPEEFDVEVVNGGLG